MRYLYLFVTAWFLVSCVQPTTTRTITFVLNAKGLPPGSIAAVRGSDKPLNWQYDAPMEFDSITGKYRLRIEIATGYLFTEYKYVVNGEFEFPDGENRRAIFTSEKEMALTDTFNKR